MRPRDLANFTYQLGVLVSARVPLSEGLIGMAQQERDPKLRGLIMDVAKRIQSGERLSAAMEAHQSQLGEVYVQTIHAAEKSGNLPKVLEHLTDMLEAGQEQSRLVRGAMTYPACVVIVLALAVLFLCGFVVPKFAKIFQSKSLKLPVFTEMLMAFGFSLQHYWWAYLMASAALAFAARLMWMRPNGRALIDRAAHRVPYINAILVGSTISRFARIFSVSLQSGLGLIESLELAGKVAPRAARCSRETCSAWSRRCAPAGGSWKFSGCASTSPRSPNAC